MALASTTVWEVRTTGNDLNGGGFDSASPGFDYTLQDGPQVNVTDLVTNGTSTVTSATGLFTSAMVGNSAYIASGTGGIVPGVYRIVSVTNSTTVVLDRSTGLTSGTGATCRVGGALASPGRASGLQVSGNDIFVKAGTYNITTATPNVSGGRISILNQGLPSSNMNHLVGYDTNRSRITADSIRPVLSVGAGLTGITVVDLASEKNFLRNIEINANAVASVIGVNQQFNYSTVYRVVVRNANVGVISSAVGAVRACHTIGCNTGFLTNQSGSLGAGQFVACVAENSGGVGFNLGQSDAIAIHCMAIGGAIGFAATSLWPASMLHCTAAGTSSHGFSLGGLWTAELANCLAWGAGGYGFFASTGPLDAVTMQSCAAGGNTSGNFHANITRNLDQIALTADPFVNSAAGDFRLNDVAGGGALLKGTGWPQALPVI